ncbi:hypothetical protein TrVE_jg11128 [Triparma verrucosa]|uniref:NAD(P)-binding protein n=1 Tax=Triparma verrucosa TaxID=1606542 RepID=A0A9W6ZF05_9STRA|nr:hypothetical protein TrVE_jg11128 [Triparma verrucosa]
MRRYALVTGANRGLGLECVKTILTRAPEVYQLLLCSRSKHAGEQAVRNLPTSLHDRVNVIELDVTSARSITAAVAAVESITPSLQILVNNAGILEGDQTLATNFDAVRNVTEAFMPLLLKPSEPSEPSMVTTTSSSCGTRFLASLSPADASVLTDDKLTVENLISKISDLSEAPDLDIYSLSKCAVNCYTQILARSYPQQLYVTAVSPGFTNTGMCANYTGTRKSKEVELGGTVFYEALFGVGRNHTGVFYKQNSSAGTPLAEAETIETAWST